MNRSPSPSPAAPRSRTASAPQSPERLAPPIRSAEPRRPSRSGRPFEAVLAAAARSLEAEERSVDAALRSVRRGTRLSPAQLIALQAGVYRHAQGIELATKLVDKSAGAVRQTLESQR